MYLQRLHLTYFRNYESAELEFSPAINCFIGNNGVGKTNILDAVHYLSLARSFFSQSEAQTIKHGEEYFIVNGTFSQESGDDTVSCSFIKHKQKSLKCNSKEYDRISDHIGRFPAVMVSPADGALISEGSEGRRRFLNMIISQYNGEYLDALMKYNKALASRNRLLKENSSGMAVDEDMLPAFDLQLQRYGTIIHRERRILVEKLTPVFQDYYNIISLKRERVELRYKSQLETSDMAALLLENRSRDTYLQYTSAGVHRDDLEFLMEGHPVRQLGSQGQQKSYLVALKLAKFGYIASMTGITPLLLLDDLFDKFDADRVEQLVKLVGGDRFGQIFITDTHQDRLLRILEGITTDYRLFRIGFDGVEEVIHNGKDEKKQDAVTG